MLHGHPAAHNTRPTGGGARAETNNLPKEPVTCLPGQSFSRRVCSTALNYHVSFALAARVTAS